MSNVGESGIWRKVRRLSDDDRPSSSWLAESHKGSLVVKTFPRPTPSLVDHLESLTALHHPHLPEYWPVVHSKEAVHLVRPYYQGADLSGHTIDRPRWRAWAQTLLEALLPIHALGLRHGDLKPSNVILSKERLVLVDPCYDQEQMATLRYAAPEVTGLVSASPSPASDLYSLGLLLAELALGAPVRRAGNLNALLKEHMQPLPSHPPEGFTFKDWEWLGRLCHPQPAQRYTTATAALADLRDIALNPTKVLGTQDHAHQLRPPSWCGRDEELQALISAIDDAHTKAVRISAPSGLGKSALLREFRRRIPPQLEVITLPSDPEDRAKPAEVLAANLGAARMSIDELAARLNRRKGGVLMFDDLQWATPTTSELVRNLYERLAEHWTMVLAHRPGEAVWPAERTLELSPLKKSETVALCQSMLGPCGKGLTGRVHQLTQGSPLMVEALLRGLWERGNLRQMQQEWHLLEGPDTQVSLASSFILRERLLGLEDDLRAALQLGALCGRRFHREWLRPLLPAADMGQVVEQLAERYLVFSHEDGTVEFVHDKIREEALSQLSAEEAVQRHMDILHTLEQDFGEEYHQRVHHAKLADCRERAWEPARLGALESLQKSQWHSAAQLLEIALEDPHLDSAEKVRLGAEWGDCEAKVGRPFVADRVIEKVRRHASSPEEHVRLNLVALWALAGTSDPENLDRRMKLLRQTAEHLGEPDPAEVSGLDFVREILMILLPLRRSRSADTPDLFDYYFNVCQTAFEFNQDLMHVFATVAGWNHIKRSNSLTSQGLRLNLLLHVVTLASFLGKHSWAMPRVYDLLGRLHDLDDHMKGILLFRAALPIANSGRLREALSSFESGFKVLEPFGYDARTVYQFQTAFQFFAGRRHEALSAARVFRELDSLSKDHLNRLATSVTLSLIGEKIALEDLQKLGPDRKLFLLNRLLIGLQHFLAGRLTESILSLREADSYRGIGPGFYSGFPANWLTTAYRYLIERMPNEAYALKKKLLRLAKKSVRRARKLGAKFPLCLPHALREQALLANLRGDDAAARHFFHRSEQVALKIGMPFEIAWTLYARARVAQAAGWPEADPMITRRTRDFLASFEYFVPGLETAASTAEPVPQPAHADRFQSLLQWGREIALTIEPSHTFARLHEAAVDLLRTPQVAILNHSLEVLAGRAAFSREAAGKALLGLPTELDRSTVAQQIASAVYWPIREQGHIRYLLVASHTESDSLHSEDTHTLAAHLAAVTEAALQNGATFAEERRQQEAARQQAREFEALFRDSSLSLAVCDSRGLLLERNTRFEVGLGPIQRIQQAFLTEDQPLLAELLQTAGTQEIRYLSSDHAVLWAQLTVTPLPGKEYLLALLDVSDQRRQYLEQLETVEQRLLASELHDSLSAPLVALHMRLQLAQAKGEKLDGELLAQLKSEAGNLRNQLLNVEQVLRRVPEEQDLQTELRKYLEEIPDLEVDFQYRLPRSPKGMTCLFLYRIVCEAVTNVRRHAGTNRCSVHLWHQDHTLHCTVSDQGRGFDQPTSGRQGLHNIRHRVQLLGGECRVTSAPGKGTRLSVRVPNPHL